MSKLYIICKIIILYILEPAMLLPLIGWSISHILKKFQRPPWIALFSVVIFLDVIQGVFGASLACLHHNNQWLRHFSQPILFFGYVWTIYLAVGRAVLRRRVVALVMVLGVAVAVFGMRLTGLALRNSVFSCYMSLVFVVLSALCLRDLIGREDERLIEDMPEFWLFSSFLTWGSGTLLFNSCSNYFLRTLPNHLIGLPWLATAVIIAFYFALQMKVFLCPKPRLS